MPRRTGSVRGSAGGPVRPRSVNLDLSPNSRLARSVLLLDRPKVTRLLVMNSTIEFRDITGAADLSRYSAGDWLERLELEINVGLFPVGQEFLKSQGLSVWQDVFAALDRLFDLG